MYLVLVIFSTITACLAILMVLHILTISKGRSLKKVALAAFTIALTFRILKSVFYFLLYPSLSNWILAFGFLGFSLLGPFLYYYFEPGSESKTPKFTWFQILHVLFPLTGFVVLLISPQQAEILYFLCLISMSAYLALAYRNTLRQKNGGSINDKKWDKVFLRTLCIMLAAFFLPYLIPYPHSYAVGTAIASMTVFFMVFLYLRNTPKLSRNEKNHHLSPEQKHEIIYALEQGGAYRDSSITLHSFADGIGLPQYIVARATKENYGKSFKGAINFLRIKDIQQRLMNDSSEELKIEDLAYDAGFNTISVFYSAFKKETSMSPREYQKTLNSDYLDVRN